MFAKNALVLIGISGVGKTTAAGKFSATQFLYRSADDEIANLLSDEIQRAGLSSRQEKIDVLAEFVGKFGAARHGGLEKKAFLQRQELYRQAELEDLKNLPRLIDSAWRTSPPRAQTILYDSTGSFCEVLEPEDDLYRAIAHRATIVHLTCSPEQEQEILERQLARPKPMLYRFDFFERALRDYSCSESDIVPDDFLRFVFPRLIAERRVRYEALAHVSVSGCEILRLGKKSRNFGEALSELVLDKRNDLKSQETSL